MDKPTVDQLNTFLNAEFPQTQCTLLALSPMAAVVRHPVGSGELRPGGTVSGPVMMGLADVALYLAILGEIGIVPLAVTTSLSFNFLRKPKSDAALVAVCKLIKLGKTLAVGEVSIYSENDDAPVAHAVGTYSIPKNQMKT